MICLARANLNGIAMKTLGLLGGMSWESTALYYKLINEQVRARLGALRSAPILLHSFDFEGIATLQHAGRWDEAGRILGDSAASLEQMGAQCVILCTNTMHKVADAITRRIQVPFLHLADATARQIRAAGYTRVALLGTKFTMQEDFYKAVLRTHGLQVVVPDSAGMQEISRIIYDELCQGKVHGASRECYRQAVQQLAAHGAECVILGCTEITMLVGQHDLCLPVFDTTAIHAQAAADFAIDGVLG